MDTKIILSANLGGRHAHFIFMAMSCASASGDLAKKPDGRHEFKPVRLAGDRGSYVDAHPDGFPDPGIAPICEPLGEYHCGCFFFLFNLVGLPTYPSLYDKFLLAVSMGFNLVSGLVCVELEFGLMPSWGGLNNESWLCRSLDAPHPAKMPGTSHTARCIINVRMPEPLLLPPNFYVSTTSP